VRVVIFHRDDFEAITVVDVPETIISWHKKDNHWRLTMYARPKAIRWCPDPCSLEELQIKCVDVHMEKMFRTTGYYRNIHGQTYPTIMETWVGFGGDDVLEVQSMFLPGQQWEVIETRRDAYWNGLTRGELE